MMMMWMKDRRFCVGDDFFVIMVVVLVKEIKGV